MEFKLLDRIKNRKFSKYAKLAISNSYYSFLTSVTSEIGAIIFTIALARILMPELFGLYNLALSTILIFVSFSNLGIGETLTRFLSKELEKKKNSKAWSVIAYLAEWRLVVTLATIIIMLALSRFISDNVYHKPLTLAIIAGALYLTLSNFSIFLQSIFFSFNDVKVVFKKELVFQISRVLLVPLGVVILLKSYSSKSIILGMFLLLSWSYLLTDSYMVLSMRKLPLLKDKNPVIGKLHKRKINNFLFVTSTIALSGIFFSYIDKVILGRFVTSESIGYYSAAFGIVGSVAGMVTFGAAFLPIFSRMQRKNMDRMLAKTLRGVLMLGTALFLITIILSPLAINIIFGSAYSPSKGILEAISLLIVLIPLTSIYLNYFLSIGKQKTVAKFLIISTIVNIVLTYIFVSNLVYFGDLPATYGAGIATVISQIVYWFSLHYSFIKLKNKNQEIL